LKDFLSYTKMPKATYMYWQKRLGRVNPDRDLENKIKQIRAKHKNYRYRRITGELRNQGLLVNKKKVQRIVQKLNLQVTSFTRKAVNTIRIREKLERLRPTGFTDVSLPVYLTRKSRRIPQNLSIMKWKPSRSPRIVLIDERFTPIKDGDIK
jgi:hypothetical protein